MIQVISVIREAYELWNNPSHSRLNPEAVVRGLNRVFSQRMIELGLSGGSYLAQISAPFTIDNETRTRELATTSIDTDEGHFLNVMIQCRAVNSTDAREWQEVLTGNFSDWTVYQNSPKLYGAFYGSADSPTLIVNHPTSNLQYRLIYEPKSALAGEDSATELDFPRLFQPLLVYDTAIEAGELIDDESSEFQKKYDRKLKYLIVRQQDALERFKDWLRSRKNQAATVRQGFHERTSNQAQKRFNLSIPHSIDVDW